MNILLALFLFGLTCARAQQIALTFDDLPAHGALPPGVTREQIAKDILAALKASGTPPVYGFVNGVRIQENAGDAAVLDLWRKAGYPLGNHTWSHINLDQHTAAEFEADLLKNEPVIADRMKGADWHWLRYPFLAEGDSPEKTAEVRTFLADHHYRIAGVTMSFGDYLYNAAYVRCLAKGDSKSIPTIETAYLDGAQQDLDERRAMAKALVGHDIPYVLLMHVGALDAHILPRLLALYRQSGMSFVSLEQAEQDPFYANDLDPRLPALPDSLAAALALKGLPIPHHDAHTGDLDKLCR